MKSPYLNRRTFLSSIAAAPVAASLPSSLWAQTTQTHTFKLGAFEVTTLLAENRPVPNPHNIFGINVSEETFNKAATDNGLNPAQADFYFTPTLVNTGAELILFDTGTSVDAITSALAAAGHTPSDINRVVITHMHGDHIGGIGDGGALTFESASLVTGSAEMDHWDFSGDEGFEGKIRPLQDRFDLLDDGGEVVSGITALFAPGHTPGHMAYHLESEGQRLVLGADFANHHIYSLAHPDWEMLFDADKAQAAATRRSMLDMMATDQVPLIGYHMPFPAHGMVEKSGDGFTFVPLA
ncbi:MBL fold metallo-hydrolase [Celeribacter marinus]|uniref:MBL fold metallo-hydrolase n=1 Tax=Celeribacter marinus TaxID=1397108 RepID=UPI003F6B0E5A